MNLAGFTEAFAQQHEQYMQAAQTERVQACNAAHRKFSPFKSGPHKDKYAIWHRESAMSAINLRHNAKPPLTKAELSTVLRSAARYAPKEAQAAREKDKAANRL